MPVEPAESESEQKKPHDYPGNSEVYLKLHDIPHPERRCFRKDQASHLRDDFRAARVDWLVRPQRPRNERQNSLPYRFTVQVFHVSVVDASRGESGEIVLIQAGIEREELLLVSWIEELEIPDDIHRHIHSIGHRCTSPDDVANFSTAEEVTEEEAYAEDHRCYPDNQHTWQASGRNGERSKDDDHRSRSIAQESTQQKRENRIDHQRAEPEC